jgi:hypothetical protein
MKRPLFDRPGAQSRKKYAYTIPNLRAAYVAQRRLLRATFLTIGVSTGNGRMGDALNHTDSTSRRRLFLKRAKINEILENGELLIALNEIAIFRLNTEFLEHAI